MSCFVAFDRLEVLGIVLPYISHISMCVTPKGRVLLRFGLIVGIEFAHLGLESGMVRPLHSSTPTLVGVYERIHCFNSK